MPFFLRAIAARGFNIQKTGDKTGMTQVTLKQDGKTLTALLSGEIDHHWAAILREKIDERAAAAAPAILILDFSAVTFMDSSGIGLILGRHKLVSAMGGVVVNVIVMLLCGVLFTEFYYQGAARASYLVLGIIGFFGAILSILGDLSFSLIKRSCHIKDFGQVIPGHGGILDRFDSVIFTAPFVYLLVSYLPLAGA